MLERLEQQKKLTANQWRIILTTNLGDMLDFFDFFLIGYVLAFILKEWHLTYGQSAIILVSAGLGAVPGAFFWGWMGDRIGRRTVFMLTALNVSIATGIMYFTPDQNWLIPASGPGIDDPLLGAGIAALPDAYGAARGGAPLTRLGFAMRSRRDRAANDIG